MEKIKLFKKYSDGEVKSLELNDTPENVRHLLSHGFFLTEEEASSGEVKAPEPAPKPAAKAAVKKK